MPLMEQNIGLNGDVEGPVHPEVRVVTGVSMGDLLPVRERENNPLADWKVSIYRENPRPGLTYTTLVCPALDGKGLFDTFRTMSDLNPGLFGVLTDMREMLNPNNPQLREYFELHKLGMGELWQETMADMQEQFTAINDADTAYTYVASASNLTFDLQARARLFAANIRPVPYESRLKNRVSMHHGEGLSVDTYRGVLGIGKHELEGILIDLYGMPKGVPRGNLLDFFNTPDLQEEAHAAIQYAARQKYGDDFFDEDKIGSLAKKQLDEDLAQNESVFQVGDTHFEVKGTEAFKKAVVDGDHVTVEAAFRSSYKPQDSFFYFTFEQNGKRFRLSSDIKSEVDKRVAAVQRRQRLIIPILRLKQEEGKPWEIDKTLDGLSPDVQLGIVKDVQAQSITDLRVDPDWISPIGHVMMVAAHPKVQDISDEWSQLMHRSQPVIYMSEMMGGIRHPREPYQDNGPLQQSVVARRRRELYPEYFQEFEGNVIEKGK